MEVAYLTVIVFTHLAFAGIFLFLHVRRPSAFLKYFVLAWVIESARVMVLVAEARGTPLSNWVLTVIAILYLPVTWLLLSASADFVGRRVSRWWVYSLTAVAVFPILNNLVWAPYLAETAGAEGERISFYAGFVASLLLFVPGGLARLTCMRWFLHYWRRTQQSGALIASVFFFVHALGSLAVPVQVYFSYTPPESHLFWFFEILGLSVGAVIVVLNRQHLELEATEKRHRLLFERGPYPMWVYDLNDLSILAVNDAAVEQYGYSREEFLEMTLKDVRPPQDIPALLETVSKARTEKRFDSISRHLKKDGTVIDVEIASYPLVLANQQARIVLARDITRRKQLEREKDQLILQLKEALASVKTLSGLLPICASCKKIRNDQGYWMQVEHYVQERSEAAFTHSICPECAHKLYPKYFQEGE